MFSLSQKWLRFWRTKVGKKPLPGFFIEKLKDYKIGKLITPLVNASKSASDFP
jgi:hypothetical protein